MLVEDCASSSPLASRSVHHGVCRPLILLAAGCHFAFRTRAGSFGVLYLYVYAIMLRACMRAMQNDGPLIGLGFICIARKWKSLCARRG